MNYLSVENLSKSFGEQLLFQGLSFGLERGNKIALIASNGAGKSTLLRILAGAMEPDQGVVTFRKGIRVAYLEQDPEYLPGASIYDIVRDQNNPAIIATNHYEKCVEKGDPDLLQQAAEEMERIDGWNFDVRMDTVLSRLKISDSSVEVAKLSGGERKRVALAKALLDDPDLILLDEPTNHLDLEMIEWLEDFLANSSVTILMVTHDRYFLENIVTEIIELEDNTFYRYKGNYAWYLSQRELRLQATDNNNIRLGAILKREMKWLNRAAKARATHSKSRIEEIRKMQDEVGRKRLDRELSLDTHVKRLGNTIIELHGIEKSYGDKKVVDTLTYSFKKGERLGIVGPNGAGKTTLIRMISGAIEPDAGEIVRGVTVDVACYVQDIPPFPDNKSVIDVVRDVGEVYPLAGGKYLTAAQMLIKFLFPSNMHYVAVNRLSGGEKRRLYLLTVLMLDPNFLILDEPTNDLDLLTLNVLEEFLDSYRGCLVIISHDRYFMDKLVDHLFVFGNDGQIRDFVGNYSLYHQEQRILSKESASQEKLQRKEEKKNVKPSKSPKQRKLNIIEKRELESLMDEIPAFEEQKQNLEDKLNLIGGDYQQVQETAQQLEELNQLIEEKTMRWLELEEIAEGEQS